jgi:hypothetical protein
MLAIGVEPIYSGLQPDAMPHLLNQLDFGAGGWERSTDLRLIKTLNQLVSL